MDNTRAVMQYEPQQGRVHIASYRITWARYKTSPTNTGKGPSVDNKSRTSSIFSPIVSELHWGIY